MSGSGTVRYAIESAPGGLAFVQELMNTISAGKPRTRDLLTDLAEAQAWLDQALEQWSRTTGTSMARIELDHGDQEQLRAFRDDLRRAAGQGRDDTLPRCAPRPSPCSSAGAERSTPNRAAPAGGGWPPWP
ncbi:ABATE domain-containing protein [Streptomyces chiangmaiensis]